MAYFAKIDESGIVLTVISIANSVIGEPEKAFPETEKIGSDFIVNTLGLSGEWRQTSYNMSFRKNYAGIGFFFDATRNAFIPPKPYPSWVLDEQTCLWNPPIQYLNDGKRYEWNETTTSWKEITQ